MNYTSRGLRRRRDSDKWEVKLSHKDPLSDEIVTSYHTIEAKTEAQARKKRDQLIRELNNRGCAIASSITIRELLDEFIDHKEKSGSIEASTVYHYRKDARVVCRYIGDVRVADLSIPIVDNWTAQMTAEGLKPRTVAKPFRLLKQAMKYAMATDLVTKNPCEYCKPPKIGRKKPPHLSREERTRMRELVRYSLNEPLGLAIELALTTGMRRGEICGLRWSDLNDDGSITVNRAVGETAGSVYDKDPKTDSGRRTIPLTPRLFAYLKAMRADSTRMLRSVGVTCCDPYILGTQASDSKPYQPTRLTREFQTFCRMNGFEGCSFHDLRHTFATMLISEGVDIRTVSSYLGHANVAVTLNTYAEEDPEAKWAAVARIQDAFDIDESDAFELPAASEQTPEYTIAQLEEMLAKAKKHAAASRIIERNERISA